MGLCLYGVLPSGTRRPTIPAKATGALCRSGEDGSGPEAASFVTPRPSRGKAEDESLPPSMEQAPAQMYPAGCGLAQRMTQPLRIVRALISLFSSARYVVHGDSMLRSLASGESVLAVRLRLPKGQPRRGDIVVLRNPVETGHTSIKRVIGLPNEDIRLEGGLVYINEVPVEDAYLNRAPSAHKEDRREWWTGPEEYVVLGDNRNDSQDSRAFGPVNRQLILGRVWFRCWPPRAWGWVPGKELG